MPKIIALLLISLPLLCQTTRPPGPVKSWVYLTGKPATGHCAQFSINGAGLGDSGAPCGAPQVLADWNATTGLGFIKNKPPAASIGLMNVPGGLVGIGMDGSVNLSGTLAVGTPLPADNAPAGSLNFAGNLYQNGIPIVGQGTFAGQLPFSCPVSSVTSIACNHHLGTLTPWVTCYDSTGNLAGGSGSSYGVNSIVATSPSIATIGFTSSATGTCLISSGSMGPTGNTGPTGPAGPVNQIQYIGGNLPVRSKINFIGTLIYCKDNTVTSTTDCAFGSSSPVTFVALTTAAGGNFSTTVSTPNVTLFYGDTLIAFASYSDNNCTGQSCITAVTCGGQPLTRQLNTDYHTVSHIQIWTLARAGVATGPCATTTSGQVAWANLDVAQYRGGNQISIFDGSPTGKAIAPYIYDLVSDPITTTVPGSVVVAWASSAGTTTVIPGSGFTMRGLTIEDKTLPAPGVTAVTATITGSNDAVITAIAIHP